MNEFLFGSELSAVVDVFVVVRRAPNHTRTLPYTVHILTKSFSSELRTHNDDDDDDHEGPAQRPTGGGGGALTATTRAFLRR